MLKIQTELNATRVYIMIVTTNIFCLLSTLSHISNKIKQATEIPLMECMLPYRRKVQKYTNILLILIKFECTAKRFEVTLLYAASQIIMAVGS